jgi:hypothetical protein
MPVSLINQNGDKSPLISAPFMLALASEKTSKSEKELIVNAFDDWNVLTPTWFEVADYLKVIECLSEDESFGQHKRAALLSSKVAYCLGDYETALHFALNAGELFSLQPQPMSGELGAQDNMVSFQLLVLFNPCLFSTSTKSSSKRLTPTRSAVVTKSLLMIVWRH